MMTIFLFMAPEKLHQRLWCGKAAENALQRQTPIEGT